MLEEMLRCPPVKPKVLVDGLQIAVGLRPDGLGYLESRRDKLLPQFESP